MSESYDVVVVGAGPTGLACAIEAQKAGFGVVNIEKGCLVNSLYNYPANMIFFTTPELLEIGDIPFTTAHQKPTRSEALEYYRKVTERYRLDVRQYENVELISGSDGRFIVETRPYRCGTSICGDRKSTRLNSSHLGRSYDVF